MIKLKPIRMLFPKSESVDSGDFRIYACETENNDVQKNRYGNISIKGIMQRLELGEEYAAELELDKVDPKFGASYNVVSILQELPQTPDAQRTFLAAMVTERQLGEIYKSYPDDDIIQLILDGNFNWEQVKYLGEHTYNLIRNKVINNLKYKEAIGKFARFGIDYQMLAKLEKKYKSILIVIQKLTDNPYEALTSMNGWGFKRADKVARAMGINFRDKNRIMFGIRYTIEENENNGHTFIFRDELLRNAASILEIEEELIEKALEDTEQITFVEDKVSLTETYNAEKYIAKRMKEILGHGADNKLNFDPEEFVSYIENKYRVDLPNGLTDQQKSFFNMIKEHQICFLVGFAGAGKTSLQQYLLELLDKLKLTYVLLSPSAQAAKVTKKYTGFPAQTIHRRIGLGIKKNDEGRHDIQEDFLIIDESGMCDVFILSKVFAKIKNKNTRVLFVGDPFQLASIGAGSFLQDSIDSGLLPTTTLDVVFRYADGGLLNIATKIRKGERFAKNNAYGRQLYGTDLLINYLSQDEIDKGYQHYYNYLLKEFAPEEIMVMSPTKKNKLGTVTINKYIQSVVNQEDILKKEYSYGKEDEEGNKENILRVGDYVLNTVNMYEIINMNGEMVDLINGDSGIVTDIRMEDDLEMKRELEREYSDAYGDEEDYVIPDNWKKGIIVDFDDIGEVRIGFESIFQLLHAWCRTGHKAQGDSSPGTLVVADKAHKFQLTANLLYTMLTRTKKKCILLTQAETINYAIGKVESKRRNTHLKNILQNDTYGSRELERVNE